MKIANAYPLSGPAAVPANKLEAAVKAIDLARSELENALFRDGAGACAAVEADGPVWVREP
ncbi:MULTISPECIES: hypothetical protein [unclassified Streptomyces]|uniref:hypothetical protein n=1 Tax=unclassified Streptomyces TaxID=2593676 RepID=UPI00114D201F|nr:MULTISPECIES: hypothetical protein [unclassified Streptomyces]MYR27814.1 hypothetical protein [Streptomyces sp. SID4945]